MTARETLTRLRTEAGHRWRFADRHRFVDRRTRSGTLLIVIAGHKPTLWPLTLERFARAKPAAIDACLVTPGVDRPELAEWAAEHGWSYLATRAGHVSVAQNLTIRAHPDAELIHKVDEDVFVSPDYFERMEAGFHRTEAELDFLMGFCAPMLNVNGFSYPDVLRLVGADAEFRDRFETLRRASDNVPAQADGDAAVFLWEHTVPVDEVARRAAEQPPGYRIVPHRFSIGAILYRREVWDEMRGFKRLEPAPGLGEDEQHICVSCLSRSRAMVVLNDVYAGHFAFGSQMPAMERAFGHRLSSF